MKILYYTWGKFTYTRRCTGTASTNCSEVGQFDDREIIVLLLIQKLVCTCLIQNHGIMR